MSSLPEAKQLENRIAIAELAGGFVMLMAGAYVMPDSQFDFPVMLGSYVSMIRGLGRAMSVSYHSPDEQ